MRFGAFGFWRGDYCGSAAVKVRCSQKLHYAPLVAHIASIQFLCFFRLVFSRLSLVYILSAFVYILSAFVYILSALSLCLQLEFSNYSFFFFVLARCILSTSTVVMFPLSNMERTVPKSTLFKKNCPSLLCQGEMSQNACLYTFHYCSIVELEMPPIGSASTLKYIHTSLIFAFMAPICVTNQCNTVLCMTLQCTGPVTLSCQPSPADKPPVSTIVLPTFLNLSWPQ